MSHASLEILHNLLNALPDAVIIGTPERRLYANSQALALFGYTSLNEFMKTKYSDLVSSSFITEIQNRVKRKKVGEHLPSTYYSEIQTREGTIIPVEINAKEIIYDGQVAILNILRDTRKRKELEKEIEYLNQVLLAIRNVNQLIVTEKDRGRLLQKSTELLIETKGYLGSWIAIFDSQCETVSEFYQSNVKPIFNLVGEKLRTTKYHCIRNLTSEIKIETDSEKRPESPFLTTPNHPYDIMSMTLEHESKKFGVFTVAVPKGMTGEGEIALFKEVGDDISYALNIIETEKQKSLADERLKNANRIAHMGYWFWDISSGDVEWSETIYEIFGVTPETFKPNIDNNNSLTHPDDLEALFNEVNKAIEEKTVKQSPVTRIIRPSGEIRFVENLIQAHYDEDGTPVSITGVVQDVTNRVILEQELAERNRFFNLISSQSVNGIGLWDLDGRLVYFNEIALSNMNWDNLEGKIGSSIEELFGNGTEYRRRFDRIIETQTDAVYEDFVELPIGEKWFLSTWSLIKDEKDANLWVLVTSLDITEKKQAETKLQQIAIEKRAILDLAGSIIVSINTEGIITSMNKYGAEFLGYDVDEIIGLNWFENFFLEEDIVQIKQIQDGVLSNDPDVGIVERKVVTRDGKIHDIRWYNRFITDLDGNRIESISFGVDVTQEKLQRDRILALHHLATRLSQATNIEQVSELTLDIIRDLLGFRMGSVGLVQGENLVFGAFREQSTILSLPLNGKGISVQAVNTGEPQLVHDTTLNDNYVSGRIPSGSRTLSELDVPIVVEGRVLGVINLESNDKNTFSDDDQTVLEILANHVSSAMTRISALDKYAQQVIELEKSKQSWEDLISSIPDAVLINQRTKFIYASQQAAYLLGYDSPSEIVGQDITQFYSEEDGKMQLVRARDRLEGRDVLDRYELNILRKDGFFVPVDVNVKLINYGGVQAILGIHRDISDRKRSEERLNSLYSMAVDLSYVSNMDELVTATFNILRHALNLPHASFQVVKGDNLVTLGVDLIEYEPYVMPISGKGITTRAVREKRTIVLDDVRDDPDFIKGSTNTLSELAVPIIIEDEVIGVLNVESETLAAYSEEDARMVEILARTVGATIKRIEADIELSESEKRFRDLIESALLGALVIDGDKILYLNQNAAELLGVDDPEELIGESSLQFVHPDYQEQVTKRRRMRKEGVKIPTHFDIIFISRDGTMRDVSLHVSQIQWNGKTVNLSLILDITEEKKANQRLEAVYQHTMEIAKATSVESVAEISLSIIRDVLGYEYSSFQIVQDDKLVTVNYFDKYWPEGGNRDSFMSLPLGGPGVTTKVAREGKPIFVNDSRKVDFYVQGSGGDSLSELAVPILGEYGVVGVLNVESHVVDSFSGQDQVMMEIIAGHAGSALSRIWQLEAQVMLELDAERAKTLENLKTEFMNTATHEIRTPISVIKGYSELITELMDEEKPVLRGYFEVVQRNITRLEALSNDLLDVQRLESGRIYLNKELCSVSSMVEELHNEMAPIFQAMGYNLIINNELDVEINCDKNRLYQVLINLMDNARKYSSEGSDVILDTSHDVNSVLFSVSDQGIGIEEEDKDKLFKPFPDIHNPNVSHGSGLGLSICKGLVELHGGRIWVESEGRGNGSTFSFSVPIQIDTNLDP